MGQRESVQIYRDGASQRAAKPYDWEPGVTIVEIGNNDFGPEPGPALPDDPWSVGWHIYGQWLRQRAFEAAFDAVVGKVKRMGMTVVRGAPRAESLVSVGSPSPARRMAAGTGRR